MQFISNVLQPDYFQNHVAQGISFAVVFGAVLVGVIVYKANKFAKSL